MVVPRRNNRGKCIRSRAAGSVRHTKVHQIQNSLPMNASPVEKYSKLLAAFLLMSLWYPSLSGGEADPEAVQVLSTAGRLHEQDWKRWKVSHGEGHLDWTVTDGSKKWSCDTRFEVSDKNLWFELVNASSDPPKLRLYDSVQLVADGKMLTSACRSRFYRPGGYELSLNDDDWNSFGVSTQSGIDPRLLLVPYMIRVDFTPKLIAAGKFEFQIHNRTDDLITVRTTSEKINQFYTCSRTWEGRLVQYKIQGPRMNVPHLMFDYEYLRHGDVIAPSTITRTAYNNELNDGSYLIQKMTIDSLEEGTTLQAFDISSLEFPPGTRMIDRRQKEPLLNP